LLASLDHPHIVPIYDFVEHDGLCLLVMEYLPGGTVWSRARDGLSAQSACAIVVAACAGLHYAHGRGVLHRDVKPDNLVFSGEDVLKVTDFGIAKVVGAAATAATRAGYVLGTPAYIAPEQATSQELTPATDVYATGTVLYELLAGTLPFPETTDPVVALYQHVHEDPRPLRVVAPQLPESLEEVTMRALARDPADRYPTAEDLGAAIIDTAVREWGPYWTRSSGITLRGTEVMQERATLRTGGTVAPVATAAGSSAVSSSPPTVVASGSSPTVVAGGSPPTVVAGDAARTVASSSGSRRRWVWIGVPLAVAVIAAALYFVVFMSAPLGNGPAGISQPEDIAVGGNGDLYILDQVRSEVIKRSADGAFSLYAGDGQSGDHGDGGIARDAQLDAPSSLALDRSGNLFIAGYADGRVRRVGADGVISTVVGTDQVPDSVAALAVAPNGDLILAGEHSHKVFKVTTTAQMSVLAGSGAQGFAGDGGPAAAAQLDTPSGVAVDAQGNVYVADGPTFRVRKIVPGGQISTFAGGPDSGSAGDGAPANRAQLSYPFGVAVDPSGDVLIGDVGAQNVREVKPNGVISTIAGNGNSGFGGDGGPAIRATLKNSARLAGDDAGNIYLADYYNHRVRRVSPDGVIRTIA
jgi:serine/threonine-protein kinase